MDECAIEIEAPDAATAAYIMSELVGRCEAELVAPPSGGGHWSVVLPGNGDEPASLLATIGAVERALRNHDLCEASIRYGRRSYRIRNRDSIPPQAA